MEEEDISALLGKNLDLTELTSSIINQPKGELTKIEPSQLEEKIIAESNDILEKTKYAMADVLMQVQTTPNDGELIEGAAKMINAYSGLLDSLHKIYALKEKFNQQVLLQGMRISAADKINQDNNATKVLLTREQILSTLENNSNIEETIEVSTKEENTSQMLGINDIQHESNATTQEV